MQRGLEVEDHALRDVVDDHGQAVRGRRDGCEVARQALGRRLVVVRRDGQEAVHAEPARIPRQVHRVRRVVGARVRDHARIRSDLVEHRLEQRELLVVGQRRALAGRAGEHEALGAVLHEVAGERARGVQVERAVGAERRRHCGADAPGGRLGRAVAALDSRCDHSLGQAARNVSSPTVRPGGSSRTRRTASSTPGTKASREVASWRIVSSWPSAAEQRLLVGDRGPAAAPSGSARRAP